MDRYDNNQYKNIVFSVCVFFCCCERGLELRNIILRNRHLGCYMSSIEIISMIYESIYQKHFDPPSFHSRTRYGGQFVSYIR